MSHVKEIIKVHLDPGDTETYEHKVDWVAVVVQGDEVDNKSVWPGKSFSGLGHEGTHTMENTGKFHYFEVRLLLEEEE